MFDSLEDKYINAYNDVNSLYMQNLVIERNMTKGMYPRENLKGGLFTSGAEDSTSDFIENAHPYNYTASAYCKITGEKMAKNGWILVFWYDENKEYLGFKSFSDGENSRKVDSQYTFIVSFEIPNEAKYFRVSSRHINNKYGKMKVEIGPIASQYSKHPSEQ